VTKLGGACSSGRSLFRFGSELKMARLLRDQVAAMIKSPATVTSGDVLKAMKAIAMVMYLLGDHRVWLAKMGVRASAIGAGGESQKANKWWLVAILCQAAYDVNVTLPTLASGSRARTSLLEQQFIHVCDVFTAAKLAGIVDISDGQLGIVGASSSLFTLFRMARK
jgi:hypothetical protein